MTLDSFHFTQPDSELGPFELSEGYRQSLLKGGGIDPITNRGTSAAREILAFLYGYEMPTKDSDGAPIEIDEYVRLQTLFFTETPAHMGRFGISYEMLDEVEHRLAEI